MEIPVVGPSLKQDMRNVTEADRRNENRRSKDCDGKPNITGEKVQLDENSPYKVIGVRMHEIQAIAYGAYVF